MFRSLTFACVLGLAAGTAWFFFKPGGEESQAAQGAGQPNYVHTVIFYLKKDAPAGAADGLIADAHKLLAKVPSVKVIRAGKPAEKATPNLAVKDYHVALLVLFDDYDGLKAYDEHPLHKEYVQKHIPHMERVVVYDFVNAMGK
jgi:hypothetical protein